jgi:hypothetical protein
MKRKRRKGMKKKMTKQMRRTWVALAVLATTMAAGAPLAQAQNGITMGGHIGFVLPLVTHAGGQTINDTADQFSIGFPVGVTFKGSGRMAFDMELVPFINTAPPRQTTLTVHPGLVWNLGHGWGAGGRLAFDVNSSDWGFTPLVNHSWPIRNASEHSFFKTYFIEADLPVRFNRPANAPATNAVTFAMHFGLGF